MHQTFRPQSLDHHLITTISYWPLFYALSAVSHLYFSLVTLSFVIKHHPNVCLFFSHQCLFVFLTPIFVCFPCPNFCLFVGDTTLTITDFGRGMSPQELEGLLNPYTCIRPELHDTEEQGNHNPFYTLVIIFLSCLLIWITTPWCFIEPFYWTL